MLIEPVKKNEKKTQLSMGYKIIERFKKTILIVF